MNTITVGHCLDLLKELPDNSISACITSPPFYGLRDYQTKPVYWPAVSFAPMAGLPEITIPEQKCCLGLETDLWAYVGHLASVFREVRRVLRGDGTLWLNLGDSYAARNGRSSKGGTYERGPNSTVSYATQEVGIIRGFGELPDKNLLAIPWRVALALQADGWWLRSDIPWIKRNGMPGSQQDRPTTSKEYWFLLSKAERYYFDMESIKMPAKEHKGLAGTFARKNGKNTELEVPGQAKVSHREDRDDRIPEGGRYRRDSDWFFDSLRAILDDNAQVLLTDEEGEALALTANPVGYSGAHFACFPPKLVEPMILASTSEKGNCPNCGSPWRRVVEKVGKSLPVEDRSGRVGHNGTPPQQSGWFWDGPTTKSTGEWQPSCTCIKDRISNYAGSDLIEIVDEVAKEFASIPPIILDPFAGSGTTLQVAIANRRQAIGFDNNEEYATKLAADRLDGTQIKLV